MIRTLIVEDEAPAANRLKKLLTEVEPSVEVLDILESVSSSVRWFRQNLPPDLLMLDIQLADGLSFDIFREVEVDSFIIFTTAYDEFAIKAFELNSIAYLLKPVDRGKLELAIEKFKKLRGSGTSLDIQALMAAMEQGKRKFKERFAINIGSRIKLVETSGIAYFYSLDKNTFLCTEEDRHYPLDQSLDRLEELLDPGLFFRVNRQCIVNYHAIDRISVLSKSRVAVHTVPASKDPVLVSTARTHTFRQWLDR